MNQEELVQELKEITHRFNKEERIEAEKYIPELAKALLDRWQLVPKLEKFEKSENPLVELSPNHIYAKVQSKDYDTTDLAIELSKHPYQKVGITLGVLSGLCQLVGCDIGFDLEVRGSDFPLVLRGKDETYLIGSRIMESDISSIVKDLRVNKAFSTLVTQLQETCEMLRNYF